MSSKAYRGAWRKGYQAFLGAFPSTKNPYRDHRTLHGGVTFSRGFRKFWADGWACAEKDRDAGDYRGYNKDRFEQHHPHWTLAWDNTAAPCIAADQPQPVRPGG